MKKSPKTKNKETLKTKNIKVAIKTMGTLPWFIVFVFVFFLMSIRDLVFAVAIGGLLDTAINPSVDVLNKYLMLLGVSVAISLPLQIAVAYTDGKYTVFGMRRFLNDTFRKIAQIKEKEYENNNSSEILNRMTDDVFKVYDFFTSGLSMIVCIVVYSIVPMFYLIYLDITMTLISYAAVPIFIFFLNKLAQKIKKIMVGLSEKRAVCLEKAQQAITQLEVIKSYTLEDYMVDEYSSAQKDMMVTFKNIKRKQAIIEAINGILRILPTFIVVIMGSYMIINGHITIGVLMVFLQMQERAGWLLHSVGHFLGQIKQTDARLERIYKIINTPSERSGGLEPTDTSDSVISFKNVSFAYEERDKIIDNISFDIKKGETVTVVGESGCGKSTLIKLIEGFHKINGGTIELFSKNISEIDLCKMRSNISVVPQDQFLFSGTLRENIAFDNNDSDDKKIIAALNAAGLGDIDEVWDEGLDTTIIERGENVSGGQKQRIALARAIYRDTNVFLFDEVTSALDYELEREIYKSIDKLKDNHTMMIISHRLSTAMNSDRILVMKKGKIIEQGSHNDLMKLNGEYADLYEKEFKKVG